MNSRKEVPQLDVRSRAPVRCGRLRFVAILLIFLLVAPAVAAIVATLLLVGVAFLAEWNSPTGVSLSSLLVGGTLIMLLFALPVAYLLGGLPAAVAGMLVAIADQRRGRPHWRIIWTAGLLAGGLVAGVMALAAGDDGAAAIWAAVVLGAALPSTAVCGWLVMRICCGHDTSCGQRLLE